MNELLKDMCEGCVKLKDGKCSIWSSPESWLRRGGCPSKTNKNLEYIDKKEKKLNPIKQSKRGNK